MLGHYYAKMRGNEKWVIYVSGDRAIWAAVCRTGSLVAGMRISHGSAVSHACKVSYIKGNSIT